MYYIRLVATSAFGVLWLFSIGYLFGLGLWKTGLLLSSLPFVWMLIDLCNYLNTRIFLGVIGLHKDGNQS